MQFVYLSAGGKDLLEDLVSGLAKLQALINSLKCARRETDAELLEQLESRGLQAMLNQRFPVIRTVLTPDHHEEGSVAQDGPRLILEAQPEVIPVDLFIERLLSAPWTKAKRAGNRLPQSPIT